MAPPPGDAYISTYGTKNDKTVGINSAGGVTGTTEYAVYDRKIKKILAIESTSAQAEATLRRIMSKERDTNRLAVITVPA